MKEFIKIKVASLVMLIWWFSIIRYGKPIEIIDLLFLAMNVLLEFEGLGLIKRKTKTEKTGEQ